MLFMKPLRKPFKLITYINTNYIIEYLLQSVRANQRVNANRRVTVSSIKCWKLTYLLTLLLLWWPLENTWQITQRLTRWWQQIIEIQVQLIISQTIIGVGRNCFLSLLPPSIRNFFNGHMNVSRTKSMLGSFSWHYWCVRANSIPHVIFYLNTKSHF